MRNSGTSSSSSGATKTNDNPVSEVVTLVKTYVKQNTVDELKPALRFLGFGIPGAVVSAIGGVLVLLGVLRLLQGADGERFSRGFSFLPYVIVVVLSLVGAALAVWRMSKPTLQGRKDRGR
jgi:phosphotransferase system  glucose/maltose/N-acetylglucosamine-specific IIC component